MKALSRPVARFITLAVLLASLAAGRCGPAAPAAAPTEPPLHLLIFSGQNNHDWRQTTPKLKSILAASGRFAVEVTEHPDQCDAQTLAAFDAVLSNWNNLGQPARTNWPEGARTALLDFVRGGKGFIVVHAGSSSFYDWDEYQRLAGATWKPGQTSHGSPHEFTVRIVAEHPVTRGVAPFRTTDELWVRPGLAPGARVLATGDDQPLVLTTELGHGRGFALLLGHSAEFMDTPGFQTLLLRGAEWAASGKVTLPADAGLGSAEELLLKALAGYHFGMSRQPIRDLEKWVAAVSADTREKEALARKLADLLTGDATVEAKQAACSQLSLIGSAAEVPALARLVGNPELGYFARLGLERIPGSESLAALEQALAATSGQLRVGVVKSLGARADTRALPSLVEVAREGQTEAAAAAVEALGRIGGADALDALSGLETSLAAPLMPKLQEAELQCAASLCAAGDLSKARPVLERLSGSAGPPSLRAAAFDLYASAVGEPANPRVLAALAGEDAVLRQAAIQATRTSAGTALLVSAAQRLGSLAPETEVELLAVLAERQATAALPQVLEALSSPDASVRLGALAALARLGNAAAVPKVAALCATAAPAEKAAITEALGQMPGQGVEEALLRVSNAPAEEVRLAVLRALRARESARALPLFTRSLDSASPQERREAVLGLGQLADTQACPALLAWLGKVPPPEQPLVESALAQICRREGDLAPITGALQDASAAESLALLNILAAVGGPKALAAIQEALKSNTQEVRAAALRLLADWPDATALDALASLAINSPEVRSKTLALRGLARLAPLARNRPSAEVVALLTRALPGASVNEQKALLAALGEFTEPVSLEAAATQLANPALAQEARLAVLKILEALDPGHRREVKPVLARLEADCTDADSKARLESLALKFGDLQNLSLGATATNPDGLAADGEAGPPSAAIDGDLKTYWDEVDNQKLYILRVDLKQPSKIAFLRIVGWQHHNYAPRDFEVLADGALIRKVEGARYHNNVLTLNLPATTCRSVELRITGYYGGSPAIRELEIYGQPVDRPRQ